MKYTLFFLLVLGLLSSCKKQGSPIDPPPVVEDTIASVWQKEKCLHVMGFCGLKLVAYEDPYIRTFDKTNGLAFGEYYFPGLFHAPAYGFSPLPNEYYLYENKLALLKSRDENVFILNLDNMALEQTLQASPQHDTLGWVFGGWNSFLDTVSQQAYLSGAGKYIFYNAGPDYHVVRHDLLDGTEADVVVKTQGNNPDHVYDYQVKGAWVEPAGDLLMVGRMEDPANNFSLRSAVYNETAQQLVAWVASGINYPILGQAGGNFFEHYDGDLDVYSKTTGKKVWSAYTTSDELVGQDRVMFVDKDDFIEALNPADGSLLWKTGPVGKYTSSLEDLQNNTLVAYSIVDSLIVCYDTDSGKEIFRVGGRQSGPARINGDYLFVNANNNCRMTCFKFR